MVGGFDRVVPVAAPFVALDWYGSEFGVGIRDPGRVVAGVDVGCDLEFGLGGRRRDDWTIRRFDDGAVGG